MPSAYSTSNYLNSFKTQSLVKKLDTSSAYDRCDVALELGKRSNEAEIIFPALKLATQDKDVLVRRCSYIALGYLGDLRAVDILKSGLKDPEASVRRFIPKSLLKLNPTEPNLTKIILPLLEDEDRWVRIDAAISLGKSKNNEAIEGLGKATFSSDYGLVFHACEALGLIGKPTAIPYLERVLSHPKTFCREEAINALANISSPEIIDPLIKAAADPEPYIRFKALNALSLHMGPSVYPVFAKALQDDADIVADAAKTILQRCSTPEAENLLK